MAELPKAYNPQDHETSTYARWEKSGYFNPDKLPHAKRRKPYAISMPPPNATGELHLGHAVMIALEDLLIRFERMRGRRTLWLPGTDHAAIATNAVVEKQLKKEGLSKKDLGREKFLERVNKHVAASQGRMRQQIEHLGASCDWSRERFTLDADMSRAVQTAFVRLYEDGLIYRGNRIVHWCPHCQSTLADDEVEYREERAPFYYIRYGPVVIGTARPETKFLDKVIVVHPDDARYHDLVGKRFTVEWMHGPIQARVLADTAADSALGSGAMTITPAHSFVDFDLAQKYELEVEPIINEQGRMTEAAGDLAGLPAREARHEVVERLRQKGLLEKIDEHYVHNLSVCYRCGTPVEPLVSKQWFVAVDRPAKALGGKTFKQRALTIVANGEVAIVPDRFTAVYRHWMEHLHDWCISRQIWYGHRIPVWYKDGEPAPHVDMEPPKGAGWTQDPDTLDTWFSSSLWTFSTLGWPKKTSDLAAYHPTSVLETGYDILFFWVARMLMMSAYFRQEIPFRKVYLHGLVRDKQGRKMSKSLGNGIDPLVMAEEYGADAVRLSLVIGTTPGNDQRLYPEKIASFRNYANKVWNVGRFLALQETGGGKATAQTLADKWILSRLQRVIGKTTADIEKFAFSSAGERLYDFLWHDVANWYLEITKLERNIALAHRVYRTVLVLLHPFMPFVTEAMWKERAFGKDLLMVEPWPTVDEALLDDKAEQDFRHLQEEIVALRSERTELKPKHNATPSLARPESSIVWQHRTLVERLAKVALVSGEEGAVAKRRDD